jgi:hypothetical protein
MVLFSPPLPTTSAVLGTVIAIPPLLYIIGQITLYPDWLRRILAYPVTMLLGMGIALSTTIAIADGFLHWGGAFERTPKYHLQKREGKWQQSDYQIGGDFITIGEIILGIYAAAAFYQAFVLHQQLNLLPLIATYLGAQTLMVLGTLLQQFADRLPTR